MVCFAVSAPLQEIVSLDPDLMLCLPQLNSLGKKLLMSWKNVDPTTHTA